MTDLVSQILAACPKDAHDLNTAEGRAAWDRELRTAIMEINDELLRGHVGNLIKERRYQAYYGRNYSGQVVTSFADGLDLEKRVEALERKIASIIAAERIKGGEECRPFQPAPQKMKDAMNAPGMKELYNLGKRAMTRPGNVEHDT